MLPRKTIVLAALFAVALVGQIVCRAQGVQNLYAEPTRIKLSGDETEEYESGKLIREYFYPIGWSKDGALAYYVEPPDEACGCYISRLVIQDLRTDKILWEKSYMGDDVQGEEETRQTYWRKHQKEFSGKLAQYGIVAQKRFALQNPVINYRNDRLTPELKVKVETPGNSLFSTSGNVVLRLVSKTNGAKTLYEKKFDPEAYEGFLDAELSGSLLSPFEPRAAVIMIETYRGYEGPPHVTRVRIVGANLTNGFR